MDYSFISRRKVRDVGHPLWYILNKKRVKGDVGIEIEAEGVGFEKDNTRLAPYWEYHVDHSLRGDDNAEYVLKKPIPFSEVPDALDFLWKVFDKNKTRLDESNRTSVHVHLNCQNFHINRLASFAAIWFTIEEILVEWCGDHRVGNLFCLRGKDAPGILSSLKSFIQHGGSGSLPDNLHYSCFNVQALQKFGSIEIRSLRGVPDKETISVWMTILERLYRLSEQYSDPREFVGEFSAYGPFDFYFQILGYDLGHKVMNEIGWTVDQIKTAMYDGVRMAQDIAYCRRWEMFSPQDIEVDPFGRVKKGKGEAGAAPAPAGPGTLSSLQQAIYMPSNSGTYWTNSPSLTLHSSPQWPEAQVDTLASQPPSPVPAYLDVEATWQGQFISEMTDEEFDAWVQAGEPLDG